MIGAGLDVDLIHVELAVGDRVVVDIDSVNVPFDSVLRLFDAAGFHDVFGRVLVSASLGSPVGPWRELGEMDLGGQKNAASLDLPDVGFPELHRFFHEVL